MRRCPTIYSHIAGCQVKLSQMQDAKPPHVRQELTMIQFLNDLTRVIETFAW